MRAMLSDLAHCVAYYSPSQTILGSSFLHPIKNFFQVEEQRAGGLIEGDTLPADHFVKRARFKAQHFGDFPYI